MSAVGRPKTLVSQWPSLDAKLRALSCNELPSVTSSHGPLIAVPQSALIDRGGWGEEQVMTKPVTESSAQGREGQKINTRSAVKHVAGFIGVAAAFLLGAGGRATLRAQGADNDKYSLISPGRIAFSDFRGYEDWSVVSSARTEEVLKVIVANPAMVKAYKEGVPETAGPFRRAQ